MYLEEDGVAPEVVPERGELMVLPLAEGPRGQTHLARRPALCLEQWVHCPGKKYHTVKYFSCYGRRVDN